MGQYSHGNTTLYMTDNQLISKLLDRGTADVIVRKELEEKLKSGKKLRVKLGIDPTGFDLTIGHAVVLRKLKQFQDAGHQGSSGKPCPLRPRRRPCPCERADRREGVCHERG